jgi:hypothetical protein
MYAGVTDFQTSSPTAVESPCEGKSPVPPAQRCNFLRHGADEDHSPCSDEDVAGVFLFSKDGSLDPMEQDGTERQTDIEATGIKHGSLKENL